RAVRGGSRQALSPRGRRTDGRHPSLQGGANVPRHADAFLGRAACERARELMRAFAVVNPAAGGGRTGRLWPGLKDRLRRLGVDFEFAETTGPGTGSQLAHSAVQSGSPFVIAVGGDGTVNEVVNGITDAAAQPLATLGVIAAGRGRDVCRNLGLATDADVAANRLVDGRHVGVHA